MKYAVGTASVNRSEDGLDDIRRWAIRIEAYDTNIVSNPRVKADATMAPKTVREAGLGAYIVGAPCIVPGCSRSADTVGHDAPYASFIVTVANGKTYATPDHMVTSNLYGICAWHNAQQGTRRLAGYLMILKVETSKIDAIMHAISNPERDTLINAATKVLSGIEYVRKGTDRGISGASLKHANRFATAAGIGKVYRDASEPYTCPCRCGMIGYHPCDTYITRFLSGEYTSKRKVA